MSSSPAERFLLGKDRAVQAGAGTGKTHALVTQYLHLVSGLSAHGRPLEPRQIAAVTFTEKAAAEMVERLRSRVHRLLVALPGGASAVAQVEPDLLESARVLGKELPSADLFERVLLALGAAPVSTFHSFAAALLRRYPALCGVDPEFSLLDQETAEDLELDTAERVVLSDLDGDDQSAATALLLAEYGFSKGTSGRGAEGVVEALCRIRQKRAEEGLSASGIANAYSQETLAAGFGQVHKELLGGFSLLAEVAPYLPGNSQSLARQLATEGIALVSRIKQVGEVKEVLAPYVEEIQKYLGKLRGGRGDDLAKAQLAEAKAQIRKGLSEVFAAAYSKEAAPLAQTFERLLALHEAAYEEAKNRISALDFTDLLFKARNLLRDHEAVRKAQRDRLAVLLVDEFQDTNPLQAELLLLLAGDPEQRGTGPGRLYIVGDRKQSIYEFRGADVGTFAGFCKTIVKAGGHEETLAVSRRSLPAVLGLANALFSQVMQPQVDKEVGEQDWLIHWDAKRDPLLPLRTPTVDPVHKAAELVVQDDAIPEEPKEPKGDDAIFREAELVARHIAELQREGHAYGDMAILFWRFTHLDRYLLCLQRAHIPYYVVKGRGFFEAQEIRDLCSALTLLSDPEDLLALIATLRGPLCGASDETLVRLHLAAALRPLVLHPLSTAELAALSIPLAEAERIVHLLTLLRHLRQRAHRLGPAACLRALCDATDLEAILAASVEGDQRNANLRQLQARALRFEEGGGGLSGFVRWLRLLCEPTLSAESLAPQAQIVDERDDVVRIMTIHQSKGLEFPVVLLPGCAARERVDVAAIAYDQQVGIGLALRREGQRRDTLQGLQVRKLRKLRAEAEAMRLHYVAVTRARDRLAFFGEGRKSKTSLRAHLDVLLQTQGQEPVLWLRKQGARVGVPVHVYPDLLSRKALSPDALGQIQAQALAKARMLPTGMAKTPVLLRLGVSRAVDLLACSRRFHLFGQGGVQAEDEGEQAGEDLFGSTQVESRLRTGALAHRLLARLDFAALGNDLEGLLLADGYDPRHPRVGEIRTRVARLVHGRLGRRVAELLRAGQVFRAHPFAVQVALSSAPSLLVLSGHLDLLVLPRTNPTDPEKGQGQDSLENRDLLTVLDYQWAYRDELLREGGLTPLLRLRRTLLGYVARRFAKGIAKAGAEPGAQVFDHPVRIGFVPLRDPDPRAAFYFSSEEEEDALAKRLLTSLGVANLPRAIALRLSVLPTLPEVECADLGCEHRSRCHRDQGVQSDSFVVPSAGS